MKTCDFCRLQKSLSEFNKDRTAKDGHDRKCRSCRSIYKKKYNKSKFGREKNSAYRKVYFKDQREQNSYKKAQRMIVSIERKIVLLIKVFDRLIEVMSTQRSCSVCGVNRSIEHMVSHGSRNATSKIGYRCVYCSKAKSAKVRSRQFGIDETFNGLDVSMVFERFSHTCFKCGSKSDLCIDHHWPRRFKQPLSHSNAVILCGKCNSSKGTKSPASFYSENERQTLEKIYAIPTPQGR